jgi:hypothetical protein
MNTLFDRMNSKNPFGKLLHPPLCAASHDEIFEDISKGQRFILSLTLRLAMATLAKRKRTKASIIAFFSLAK